MHKTTSTDDKRLQNTLKRLGVNTIPGIEEVNIFKDDSVIHFTNPKGACPRCRRDFLLVACPPLADCMTLVMCSASIHCCQHLRHQRAIPDQE